MRAVAAAATACVVVILAGCASSSTAHVSVNSGSPSTSMPTAGAGAPSSSPAAGSPSQVPPGWKPVKFATVQFAVPETWPVFDLRADPSTCIRFDVHAVYLGHVGPSPKCPATVLGKTDAVHVEALDNQSRSQVVLGSATTVAGQPALTDPSSATTRSIVVALQRSNVLVTLTYKSDPALDNMILSTFQTSG